MYSKIIETSFFSQKVSVRVLGPVQTSNFTCAESNANEKNLLFSLICIRFGTCEVRRLNRALVRMHAISTEISDSFIDKLMC